MNTHKMSFAAMRVSKFSYSVAGSSSTIRVGWMRGPVDCPGQYPFFPIHVGRCIDRGSERCLLSRARRGGTSQNDILEPYPAPKAFLFRTHRSSRSARDMIRSTADSLPRSHSTLEYPTQDADSTPVEELAFSLANRSAHVERALQAKLPVNSLALRLSFVVTAVMDCFEALTSYSPRSPTTVS